MSAASNVYQLPSGRKARFPEDEPAGYVYILSNPSMPGILKIGKSIRGGTKRAKEIDGTGVPSPFELVFEIFTPTPTSAELYAHDFLRSMRVSESREFFRCSEYLAIEVVAYSCLSGYGMIVCDYDDIDIVKTMGFQGSRRHFR